MTAARIRCVLSCGHYGCGETAGTTCELGLESNGGSISIDILPRLPDGWTRRAAFYDLEESYRCPQHEGQTR